MLPEFQELFNGGKAAKSENKMSMPVGTEMGYDGRQTSGALDFKWAESMVRESLPVGEAAFARTDPITNYATADWSYEPSKYGVQRREEREAMGRLFTGLPTQDRNELRDWFYASPMYPAYPMAIVSASPRNGSGEIKGVVLHRRGLGDRYEADDCRVVWFDGVVVSRDTRRHIERVQYTFPLNFRPGEDELAIRGSDRNTEIRFSRTAKNEVLIERPGFVGQTQDANGDERPSMRVRYNRRLTPMQHILRVLGNITTAFE